MAASATNLQAKEGGTWRTITAVSAKEAGVWQTVQEVWAKEGGVWRHSWINSDPKTYTYDASWSQSYRENNNQRSTSYLYQGEFPSSSYGQQRSLIGWDYADIQSKLAIRPVTTNITIRMSSDHWYNGDFSSILGYLRLGTHNYATKPSTWDGTEVELWSGAAGHEEQFNGGFSGARDQTKTMTVPTDLGDDLRDNLVKGTTVYAHSTNTNYYAYFWGDSASASLRPQLKITADYS